MKRPSTPLMVSLVALFFSLTGAGLAASPYIITSTHQIKPNVLNALRGRSGPAGQAGPQGAASPTGIPQITIAQATTVIASGPGVGQALCPGQLLAIGGGYNEPDEAGIVATSSYPLPGSLGWYIVAHATDNSAHIVNVYAVCTTATT